MVLIKVAGITEACVKPCSFTAALIWDLRVDWAIADVKTHKETLLPPKLLCSPQPELCKEPRHCHLGCVSLAENRDTL